MPNLATLVAILELACKDRAQLALENAALRHQLAVLKRSVKRPRVENSDRLLWTMLMRLLKQWRSALIFVKPDTAVHLGNLVRAPSAAFRRRFEDRNAVGLARRVAR